MVKVAIVYLIAWVGYWLGIDRVFYWLNRRCKRVLTCHNVFPDELCREDGGGGMSMSVSQFKRMIREVRKLFRISNDLDDVGAVTLTFDDGFLNQYEVAFKALKEMGIPAMLFVAGKNINRTDPMQAPAVDLLTAWLDVVPEDVIDGRDKLRYWIEVLRPRYVKDAAHYGYRVVEECDRLYPFSRVFAELGDEYLSLRLGGVAEAQLDEMRQAGWCIGWHSQNHYPLAAIPTEKKMLEFESPRTMRCEPMSYPYGELLSVSAADTACAERAGFPCAYSNLNMDNQLRGRYFLPRFGAEHDKVLLHFHLSGFWHFLKYRKLLPR